ncbi:transposable element Tcb1 transposase [Trichonephila clavipes]|nr:transposable element Tcb1 transposase [Trichonephila clavipes]
MSKRCSHHVDTLLLSNGTCNRHTIALFLSRRCICYYKAHYKPSENELALTMRKIIERLECERTQLEVSEELGITQSVIFRLWQRFQDDGNVSRCYSTGHPRVTTPNEDRYLAVTAKRNRRSTASDLSRQFSSATGTTVSSQTVYRRLGHIGLYARRPVRCVPLTATHCRLRLTWSREHALWTPQQWSCVMFSD